MRSALRKPDAAHERGRASASVVPGYRTWMASTVGRRASPLALWPDVRSIVMLGMNYGPDTDPLAILSAHDRAAISIYARGDDYHDLIKKRLKALADQPTLAAT